MIKHLLIRNYAIIDQAEIDFSEHLNIITGETGSGKSILLGALGLILGQRADTKAIWNKKAKCIVEATFSGLSDEVHIVLAREEFDADSELVIRRELSASGKSRAFVNDELATLKQIREICSHLVDLHQQFENLGINSPLVQMQIIDSIAGTLPMVTKYQENHRTWSTSRQRLLVARSEKTQMIKERDYLEFQLNEMDEMVIEPDRDSHLEAKIAELSTVDDIRTLAQEAEHLLDASDNSVLAQLGRLQAKMNEHPKNSAIAGISARLDSVLIELKDIESTLQDAADTLTADPAELESMQQRLDQLNRLMHKHQAISVTALVEVQQEMQQRLSSLEARDEEILKLEQEIAECEKSMQAQATKITARRKKILPTFEKSVDKLLAELRMGDARFRVELLPSEQYTNTGRDQISFQFAANKGSDFLSLKDTASGGELSRISLVIKSLIAEKIKLPTLIFDEIDSGVSGDVAKRMGAIFSSMSKDHQIISITHSPQVAARAARHFRVSKVADKKKSTSRIEQLNEDESVHEIAIMLSSSPPSEAALASAKELVQT